MAASASDGGSDVKLKYDSGTLLGSVLVICYPSAQFFGKSQASCINLGVFFLQLLLTPFLLVGWVWSVMWGCAILAISDSQLRLEEGNSDSPA
ncbi:protein SPEC3-like isoform X2 [Sycon ciliatum]|uniref:protein SPEC3-like isoform X2 n=1 Tax=Sycon ciliatum TaxID=27933 RepID=UPI0031F6EDAA